MPVSSWSNREMLEVQFKKHIRKGYVTNAVMAPSYGQARVPAGESVVVEVINNQSIGMLFTENGFVAPNQGFLRYEEIKDVHWISPNGNEVVRLKQTHSDRLMLQLRNGSCLVLDGLGSAYHPILRFFEWAIARRSPSV